MIKIIEKMTNGVLTRVKNIFVSAKIQHGTSVALIAIFQIFHQYYHIGKTNAGKLQLDFKDIRK